jgi:hypothetical protein
MDYGVLVMMACIVAWGIVEYRRRERSHRLELEALRGDGGVPAAAAEVSRWRLLTTAGVGILLLAAAGYLAYKGVTLPRYAKPIVTIGAIFVLISLPLLWMLIRDYRAYRHHRQKR